MQFLYQYSADISSLCKRHQVKTLYAFGSVLTEKFKDESDVDLIVDIDENDPLNYGELYFDLKFALEDLFNRSVDLLEDRAIRNPFLLKKINNTKQLIYAK